MKPAPIQFQTPTKTIISGKHAGQQSKDESNAQQRTVDYQGEWANGFDVMRTLGS